MNDTITLTQLPAMLAASPRIGVLIVLLVAAAVIDFRSFRIPNWLTFGGAIIGFACSALLPSADGGGLLWSIGGLGVGFGLMLPLYALKTMGAGDVKLMAMAGTFLGPWGTLNAILFTFIAGGLAAVVFALSHRAIGRLAANVKDKVQFMAFSVMGGVRPDAGIGGAASIGKLPYGISISAGTIAYVLARHLGYA
jgi:prepilin peptidase CpaA